MRACWLPIVLVLGCGGTGGTGDAGGAFASDGPAQASDGPAPTCTVMQVHYPAGAHSIAIRGSGAGLSWDRGQAMSAAADDTWVYASDTVSGVIEWKPYLDDATPARGPNYTAAAASTVDVWPHFFATHGQVSKLIPSFHSSFLPDDRAVWAYLPPSYSENTRARFPTLYMHDGQNLFDPATAFAGVEWGVDETLDGGAEDGTIRESIVIGIENTPARVYEYTPTRDATVGDGGGADLYLRCLTEELKPMVDGALRTRPGADDTAMLGSSLGGLLSAHAGVTRADVFGRIGAMSPSTWWDNQVIIREVMGTAGAAVRPSRVYVDSGDSGTQNDDVADTNLLAAAYLAIGYVEGADFHHVVQAGGQHSETYWAERLPGALRFLLGPR
jgi:predicted alpha/beta superfamily hydrolase